MKNKYILSLYDLGVSTFALSQIYQNATLDQISRMLEGDYLDFHFKYNVFSKRDIDLLSSEEEVALSRKSIEKVMSNFKKENIKIYNYYDLDYPMELKNIPNPPFFLFAKGDINVLNSKKIISIVGSRKISDKTSCELKKHIKELVVNDYVTVSGLAFGTDIIVHKETMKFSGKTVAILPSPITDIQPSSHEKYAKDIYESGGVLLSEYYKTDNYNRLNYIHRNRIISGVSQDVLITECSEKSGTMHTARFAYKQQRRIYCLNNNSSGIKRILASQAARVYENITSLL